MIKGTCFTNLDGYEQVVWPTKFVAVPRIGERVEGKQLDRIPTLKVVGVTHRIGDRDGEPCIAVELHR